MFTLLTFLFMGIFAGIFTGMIPGLHINLLSALLISRVNLFEEVVYVQHLAVFIISMSVTHTFIDSIPGIYLGAPDPSQFLTALPGHRMFMQGKAHRAVKLTVLGSLIGLSFSLLLLGTFCLFISHIYDIASSYIGHALVFISIFIIVDPSSSKVSIKRLIFFLVSGCYGAIILSMSSLDNPMFHMLSGFFGLSILIESLRSESGVAEQHMTSHIPQKYVVFPTFISSVAGLFAAFMPGFSTSQNAVVLSRLFSSLDEEDFMIILGGLNTSGMVASLGSLFAIEKARNGSIIAIQDLLGILEFDFFIILVLCMMISGMIASVAAIRLSRFMSRVVSMIDYTKLVSSVIVSIVLLSLLFDSLLGFLILFFCTLTGLAASYAGVAKNYLMGCLMIPVIFFFLL
ncbi:MAG: tripartite tricarboxylate transporter permease [Candidatus Woesearchaeota archaeon]